jgi:trehalose 6-phosphate synthase/phosphatase
MIIYAIDNKVMSKLILVSNRLPVTVEIKKENEIAYTPSTGGLATGLSSLSKTYKCVWIGFSGISTDTIDKNRRRIINNDLININLQMLKKTKIIQVHFLIILKNSSR